MKVDDARQRFRPRPVPPPDEPKNSVSLVIKGLGDLPIADFKDAIEEQMKKSILGSMTIPAHFLAPTSGPWRTSGSAAMCATRSAEASAPGSAVPAIDPTPTSTN